MDPTHQNAAAAQLSADLFHFIGIRFHIFGIRFGSGGSVSSLHGDGSKVDPSRIRIWIRI